MNLENLEKEIQIKFKNKELLREAMTHRSYLNEHRGEKLNSNERLEYLGDAVLEFTISKLLFEHFPQEPEGFLTACRSQIVQTKSLANLANELALGNYLLLSKGEEESGGRQNSGLLENAFEALIGAIFLDQGVQKTIRFIHQHFEILISHLSSENLKDAKSLLQEKAQEAEKITPIYRVLDEVGPDHAKIFTVGVYLGEKKLAEGQGRSKQEAEEAAAKAALLEKENESFT